MIRAQDSAVISGEGRKVEQPRTGHQNRGRAQLAADLGERVLHGGSIGDVGADPDGGDALGAKVVGDTLRCLLIEVEDRDLESASAQFVAGRLTHARGAAGHDRYPAHRLRSIGSSSWRSLVDHPHRAAGRQGLAGQHPAVVHLVVLECVVVDHPSAALRQTGHTRSAGTDFA